MLKFKVLKYGMAGKDVERAQKALQKAGSKIKVNGEFTIGMYSAVKCFQRKNKLKETGMIDAKTMAKLEEYLKPAKKIPMRKPPVKR